MTDLHDAVREATRRLVRSVDALTDEGFTEASQLPGWTRAHLVAHLALNAEGLGGVLQALAAGETRTMYASQQSRDADIDELSGASPSGLRDRLLGSCALFNDAMHRVPDDAWEGRFERTPGGPQFRRTSIPTMRLQELEIHHADLAVGYSAADWPAEFVDLMFTRVVQDRADGPAMLLRTPEGEVTIGEAGPVVVGSRAALTWWLLGRGMGEGLTADPTLPTLGPWR